MHATALFLATFSLLLNMAVSSPAPTSAPAQNATQQGPAGPLITSTCYLKSKAGDINGPKAPPTPSCQVDMSTVIGSPASLFASAPTPEICPGSPLTQKQLRYKNRTNGDLCGNERITCGPTFVPVPTVV